MGLTEMMAMAASAYSAAGTLPLAVPVWTFSHFSATPDCTCIHQQRHQNALNVTHNARSSELQAEVLYTYHGCQ